MQDAMQMRSKLAEDAIAKIKEQTDSLFLSQPVIIVNPERAHPNPALIEIERLFSEKIKMTQIYWWRIRYVSTEVMGLDMKKQLDYDDSNSYVGFRTSLTSEFPQIVVHTKTMVDRLIAENPTLSLEDTYYIPGLTPLDSWSKDERTPGRWVIPGGWPTIAAKEENELAEKIDIHTNNALTYVKKVQDTLEGVWQTQKLQEWGNKFKVLCDQVRRVREPLDAANVFMRGRQQLDTEISDFVTETNQRYSNYIAKFNTYKNSFLLSNLSGLSSHARDCVNEVTGEYLHWFEVINKRALSAQTTFDDNVSKIRQELLGIETKIQSANLEEARAARQQLQTNLDNSRSDSSSGKIFGWIAGIGIVVGVGIIILAVVGGHSGVRPGDPNNPVDSPPTADTDPHRF